jgi:hypothetical protein
MTRALGQEQGDTSDSFLFVALLCTERGFCLLHGAFGALILLKACGGAVSSPFFIALSVRPNK